MVDNDSTDGTRERLSSRADLTWIPLDSNRGFTAGVNLGAQRATAPFLLFLNPDAELTAGALPRLHAHLVADPLVAAAGPRFVYPDGSPQDGAFAYPSLLMTWLEFFHRPGRLLHTRWNGRLDARDDRPVSIDYPLGACMLIRRAAWNDVGGFDEGFFMYCEEVDWCMRAKRRGWRIDQVPTATVVHHGGASAQQNPDSLVYLYTSRRRLHHKHRGPLFRFLAELITRVGLRRERRRLLADAASSAEHRVAAIDRVLHPSGSVVDHRQEVRR